MCNLIAFETVYTQVHHTYFQHTYGLQKLFLVPVLLYHSPVLTICPPVTDDSCIYQVTTSAKLCS